MNEVRKPRMCREHGFTMLEVLITLFIVSVGLLGLSGLINSALRYDQESRDRFLAAVLADDIAGRMYANRAAAVAGTYSENVTAAPAACTSQSGCSSSALADYDTAIWKQLVQDSLPNGTGEVCIDSSVSGAACDGVQVGGRNRYVVTVTWWSREGQATQSFQMEVDP